jgi:phospholipid/cholesterol/gamma-HCH transport system substrate-binding protein
MTGRIGIIENSGGVGLDAHLLDDALELSADVFAFDENVNPRVKLWALYTFFSHLYIASGIDDVWNEERTDFFVGAGLSFNDEDLKALLTTAPVPSL